MISQKALERAKKDRYVKENRKRYIAEITYLMAAGLQRPSERIADFNLSPRGGKKERVAWHYAVDEKNDTLIIYVDDLLYHVRSNSFVDNWPEKVRAGTIKLRDYSSCIQWAGKL